VSKTIDQELVDECLQYIKDREEYDTNIIVRSIVFVKVEPRVYNHFPDEVVRAAEVKLNDWLREVWSVVSRNGLPITQIERNKYERLYNPEKWRKKQRRHYHNRKRRLQQEQKQ
jgi:hypothetical protein